MDITHFFDGLFVAIPATVGAIAALVAAKNSRNARKEVKSPNGTTTGQAVHNLTQALETVLDNQKTHDADDVRRFADEAKARKAAAAAVRKDLETATAELHRRLDAIATGA